jgi:hypothetical protein
MSSVKIPNHSNSNPIFAESRPLMADTNPPELGKKTFALVLYATGNRLLTRRHRGICPSQIEYRRIII